MSLENKLEQATGAIKEGLVKLLGMVRLKQKVL